MKVTSPVGEYEYRVNAVRLTRGGRIVVSGNLGVWESTIELEPGDWLALARRAARPAAALTVVALATAALRRRA